MINQSKFQKIIVTSGPTREWIDPVRYLSNASSGKMGHSIAKACLENKGDFFQELVYIAGYTEEAYKIIPGAKNISIGTTLELLDAILRELVSNTILIMAAAPVDFRPKTQFSQKIKKNDNHKFFVLELIENPDILTTISYHIQENQIQNVYKIGFAAETNNLESNALGKLQKKELDWILANSVGEGKGFGEVESTLYCYSKEGHSIKIGPYPKNKIAEEIWNRIIFPEVKAKN